MESRPELDEGGSDCVVAVEHTGQHQQGHAQRHFVHEDHILSQLPKPAGER